MRGDFSDRHRCLYRDVVNPVVGLVLLLISSPLPTLSFSPRVTSLCLRQQQCCWNVRQRNLGLQVESSSSSSCFEAASTLSMTAAVMAKATSATTTTTTTTTTRRSFGKRLLFNAITSSGLLVTIGSSGLLPQSAHASSVDPETALRNVRRAQRQLETKLKAHLDAQEYQELREDLRLDPLGSLRKNCFALVAAGDQETRMPAYQTFISALEQLDATAGLISRGRNVPDTQVQECYQKTLQSLQSFIDLVSTTTTTATSTTTTTESAVVDAAQ